MKKIEISIILISSLFISPVSADEFRGWHKLPVSLAHTEINVIHFDGTNEEKFYLGTMSGLYQVPINGEENIKTPGRMLNEPVNTLYIEDGMIYAGGDRGLFVSKDGKDWQNNFRDSQVWDVLRRGEYFFLATDAGLFLRKEKEAVWRGLDGEIGHDAVYRLMDTPKGILASTKNKVFLIHDDQMRLNLIFSTASFELEGDTFEESEEDDVVFGQVIKDLKFVSGAIYLGTTRGIFKSRDYGDRWEALPKEGMPVFDLMSLTVIRSVDGQDILCVGTFKGVYCFLNDQWFPLYEGLETNSVVALESNKNGDLLAATDAGVYILRAVTTQKLAAVAHTVLDESCHFKDYARVEDSFSNEPTIQDVHKMAVRYADADKSKIDTWKKQARMKAFLPSVSVGANRAATELYHWDSGPNPDVLSKGRDYVDWDLSVSWELSDFVWSTDQTSIDSRSKLMVELLGEVLDQVTRIYFERRRIQIELTACSYPSTGDRMASEMRVHELTALIDAYTGGDFSRKTYQQLNK